MFFDGVRIFDGGPIAAISLVEKPDGVPSS